MKISLGSWAFSFGPYSDHPISFEDTAARLSTAGYDGIEICGFPPHVTLERYPDSPSRTRLVQFLRDLRLEVSGYAADFSTVNPAAPGNRDKYLDLFRRNVDMSADLGSPTIRVDTVAAPGSVPEREYEDTFRRVAETWREAAQIALQSGVQLVWEFEPGFLYNKPSEIVKMQEEVAHPNFRILFDTSHAYMCSVTGARQSERHEVLPGGVQELLSRLKGRIGAIHLIDSDGTLHGDETSTHAPFGQGRIDFESLAPKLLQVPGMEWWTIDMCFWAGSWDLVEASRTYIANLIKHSVTTA